MARASVTYRYDADESMTCEVEVDVNYPDAVDEARQQALKLYATAMRITSDLNDEAKTDGEETTT